MAPQAPAPDDIIFDHPDLIPGLSNPPAVTLTSDTILWYFYNSPFFDQGSNNRTLIEQVAGGPDHNLLTNRVAFEQRLRTDYPYGTQFVVVHEPKADGEPWVIQRQEKTVDENTGKTSKVDVTGTYYTQGTRIVMAKSVLDVLQLRMLSVSTQLQELMELSNSMSHFSPATGHTYIPPSFELGKASSASRIGSRAGSPSLAPIDAGLPPSHSQSQSQSQTQPGPPAAADDPLTTFDDGFFLRSLDRTETYFEEYVDENPLQGEPGSFVLTHSWRSTLTRREEEKKRAEQQAASSQAAAASSQPSQLSINTKTDSQLQSGIQSGTPTPKPGTPATESFSRKGSVASLPKPGKEKRRKSKGPGSLASPATPTGPQL